MTNRTVVILSAVIFVILQGCWCMENIELAREGCVLLPGIHIQTDRRTVEELCDEVLNIICKT